MYISFTMVVLCMYYLLCQLKHRVLKTISFTVCTLVYVLLMLIYDVARTRYFTFWWVVPK
jgi:hypothetical protein